MSKNLSNIDWNKLLDRLVEMCTSQLGRESIAKIMPLPSPEEAHKSFNLIKAFKDIVANGRRPHMESLDLCYGWMTRLQKEAQLKPLELKDIRLFCQECLALKSVLTDSAHEAPQILADNLINGEEPISAIDNLLTSGGEIRADASEKLYNLTREKDSVIQKIEKSLEKIVKSNDMENILQDRFVTNREGRWVIPIKSGMQHSFEGIIHAVSQSKQTVFMEPQEIIPVNNRLREIETEIEEEIDNLLNQISKYLYSLLAKIERSKEILIECDILFAKGKLGYLLNASEVQFSSGSIELLGLKHPLLILNNEKVISNSVTLHENHRILLLSGPNAGGKTVLLKSIGLASHMARCGLLVCAESHSKIPFFTQLFVAVGDSQDVDENLSTFAAHLKSLDAATKAMGTKSLILIDEICGSTDPEEGSALARAFITQYAANKSFGVITSHLGALKLGWKNDSGIVNGSLEFNEHTGPTYTFFQGIPGQSLAIQTAKRVGIDKAIIENALNFLSPDQKLYQKYILDAEELKKNIHELNISLAAEKKAATEAKQKYHHLIEKFETQKSKMLEQSLEKAEAKVDDLINKAEVDQIFKRHIQLKDVRNQLPQIIKTKDTRSSLPQSAEEFIKKYPAGSKVFASSIGRDSVIQGHPNSKGLIPILAGSMRLLVPWESLNPPRAQDYPTQSIINQSEYSAFSSTDRDRVIDLRGQTVDEALGEVEIQMEAALHAGEDRIKIVHGHGTETLKRAIRSHLSRMNGVTKWQSGGRDSGGDGVTWVELKDSEELS